MLRSLASAIDDALDTLDEPNAVFFSQFLGSASMTFSCFPFLASSFFLSSCLFLLFFLSFLSFPFSFSSFLVFSFLSFLLSSLLFFSLFRFSNWLASVVPMRSGRYYVQYIRGSLSWVASGA